MKTTPNPTPLPLQADPKIVKKARSDNAAYAFFDGLPGEKDQDYLSQFTPHPHAPWSLEFGRPGL